MNHPVFILGLFDTGYYAARLLRDTAVPIYGFDYVSTNPGQFSKYVKAHLSPHPFDRENDLLELLLNKQQDFCLKPILIAASENFLNFICSNRSELEKHFLFILPSHETLRHILKKSAQFEMANQVGLSVPPFKILSIKQDLEDDSIDGLGYPIIIKGNDQPRWKQNVKDKAFLVRSKDELLRVCNQLLSRGIEVIAQTAIEGDCTNNFEYNALMINGEIIEENVNRKIRQYPPNFGAACYIQTVENKVVAMLGSAFVKINKIEGFSNTEFKYDVASSKYYFIETNARIWLQIELTSANAQNYVKQYYNYLSGQRIDKKKVYFKSKSLRWLDLPSDLILFLQTRKQRNYGIFELIRSIAQATNLGLLSLRDPQPFLKTVIFKRR